MSLRVERIVPTVVRPVTNPDNQVQVAIALKVAVLPLLGTDTPLGDGNLAAGVNLRGLLEPGASEVHQLLGRLQQPRFSPHVGHLNVFGTRADFHRWLEHRHLRVAARILEEVHPIVGLVRTGNDQVIVPIAVIVHRQRPGLQSYAQVNDQSGIVVLEPFQSGT